jgi:anaerobic selenocysteine-containing dehydrogenase
MTKNEEKVEEREVRTLCRMCGICCGIIAYFKGDKLVRWEPSPEYKWLGGRCPRWASMADYQYSVERLTHPLKRVNGDFKRITWDEAFDIIVSKLNKIKEKYGPEYVAINIGHPHILGPEMYFVPRVCHAFGTPNFPLGGNYCWMPHTLADYLTFGTGCYLLPRYRGNQCTVFWGSNPLMSAPPPNTRKMLMGAREQGVKWIVVDPRRIELAKMADIHLQVRPGTDGALALSWLNTIISEELYDKEFVKKWTLGFDKLSELAKNYPPEKVADICWVPQDLIKQAARMYATSKPASISGGVSLDQHTNAFQTSRAISCLKAVTGNVDKSGASTYIKLPPIDLQIRERVANKRRMGQEELPLWYDEFRASNDQQEIPLTPMIDDIFKGKIKAVIFMGKNMVVEDPNTYWIIEAFKKLDLNVNMDQFMTESCKKADIVLPAATFLERNSFRFYHQGAGLALVAPINKAVEPLGECKSDISFLLELVNRLGLSEFFPWKSDEEVLDHILRQVGTSLEYLQEHPEG